MIDYILCGIIVIQALLHHFERHDLYNRIMSKNLTEYKGERGLPIKSAHRQVLNRWKGLDGDDK